MFGWKVIGGERQRKREATGAIAVGWMDGCVRRNPGNDKLQSYDDHKKQETKRLD